MRLNGQGQQRFRTCRRQRKDKTEISGQFKTEATAQNFAKIWSVIDTTIKNGMNVLDALVLITKLQPQVIN